MKKLALILGIWLVSSLSYAMLMREDINLPQSNIFKCEKVNLFLSSDSSESGYFIGSGSGCFLEVHGSKGIFRDRNGEVWEIEYVHYIEPKMVPLGRKYNLCFIGRKDDNFRIFYIEANDSGEDFYLHIYDYKSADCRLHWLYGKYHITENFLNNPNPTNMPGYIPKGKVPDYEGRDFQVNSAYLNMTPEGGHLSYHEGGENLELELYPVFYGAVTHTWKEIWVLGIDSETKHSYFLIFYTISPMAWVIDLWNLRIKLLPLGQVKITGGFITAPHDVVLE